MRILIALFAGVSLEETGRKLDFTFYGFVMKLHTFNLDLLGFFVDPIEILKNLLEGLKSLF